MGNAVVKLICPSHGMPFEVPGKEIPHIASKIDEILKDIETKSSVTPGSKRLKLPTSGLELDYPKPGDWVLVDVYKSSIIHRNFSSTLVTVGSTYMVLPYRASMLSKEDLKEAIEAAKSSRAGDSGNPPGYTQ